MSFETFECSRFTAKSLALIEQVSIRRLRGWLSDAFPTAFGGDVKLLALGVGRLIWPRAKAAGIKRQALNNALEQRTGSFSYLDALAANAAMHCDLTGRAIEPVSAEHGAGTMEATNAELMRKIGSFGNRSITNGA